MFGDLKNTSRGFRYYEFEDRNGNKCTFQKSSIATEDCIWLGLEDASPKILHGDAMKLGVASEATCGWVRYPMPIEVDLDTRMHLTRDQAEALAKQLLHFSATGELPRFEKT